MVQVGNGVDECLEKFEFCLYNSTVILPELSQFSCEVSCYSHMFAISGPQSCLYSDDQFQILNSTDFIYCDSEDVMVVGKIITFIFKLIFWPHFWLRTSVLCIRASILVGSLLLSGNVYCLLSSRQ